MITKISDKLNSLGITNRLLSKEEKDSNQNSWRNNFAKKVMPDNQPDWHIFSFNLVPHLAGKSAIEAYENLFFKHFTIIFSNPKLTGLECVSNKVLPYQLLHSLRKENPELHDLYISHINFRWTFVLTHEEYFGPYFTTESKL